MHSTEPLWFSSEVLTTVVPFLEGGGHGRKRVLRSLWLKENPGPWSRPDLCALHSTSQDRIILGSNSAFLYIGFPSERGAEDLSTFDYDFFQLERAAAEGVSVDMIGKCFSTCLQALSCANIKATVSMVSEYSMQKVKM